MSDIRMTIADALKRSWEECSDVPFPLYEREVDAMAESILRAINSASSPMWAVWNDCNGVFEVFAGEEDARAAIDDGASGYRTGRETVVPVKVYRDPLAESPLEVVPLTELRTLLTIPPKIVGA